jgi:lipoprotein-anchoring transpeptidase ErfK/SrfK
MHDHSILSANLTSKWRRPVQLFMLIAIGMTIITGANGRPQAPRKSPVGPESKPSPAKKHVGKAKPLSAVDHRAAEKRLAELGYWTGKVDGRWDETSRQALIAFQKVERLKPTGQLTRADFERLLAANRPAPIETGEAHIEVDLVRQTLFIIDDAGVVTKILPVSSGSGKEFKSQGWARDAVTHPGRYRVRQKLSGWKKSPLGELYYPVYFMYGTAIHGHPSVPTKPASHGCVRIPMVVAKQFNKMIPLGMPVIVHKGEPPPPLPTISGQGDQPDRK